jgi:transposase-like protein/predicted RNA-binding Zn-ribbon protein involved in translation (DUF1610 family)
MDIFKGMNILEFTDKFKDDNSCREYLAQHKWSDGFVCPKCGCKHHHQSKNPYIRRCRDCYHVDSATAGTLFHKVKFGLRKAFTMVFMMTTTSKGQSANQFAKTLSINKDTAWLFAQKIRHAMDSSRQYPLTGKVEVDEAFIGGKEEGNQGRGNKAKDAIVVAIEKTRDENGIKRAYAMKIGNTSSGELKKIFEAHISAQAQILTDKWTGYSPLKETYQITQEKSRGGENFELMHRYVQGLKSWLRGIYHHVDSRYLQVYLDEYSFRFNRSLWKESIFDKLIQRMVKAKPLTYKTLIINVST